ncbi:MAG: leucine-rich repeat domain-containing protein [Ruminococcus sp.]|nr:leucine-rich repeat domain-containing protein [Ruminococcus sp.]
MKMNKFFSVVMAGISLLSITAMNGSAVSSNLVNEPVSDGTFGYELRNGSYTIISCYADAIVDEIPELRNGYAVTAIDNRALASCTSIKTLYIPDTITSIGDNAFAGCESLTEIRLPKKIKNIGDGLFMGCTKLEKVEIPDAVNTIGSYAFYNCSMLTEVILPGELSKIEPMAFSECSSIENIDASKCSSYVFEDGLLMNKSKTNIIRASVKLAGDVYIPDGITTIEAGSFSVCAGIENLFLPSSVTYIGDDAFGYCVNLKNIDFSEGLQTIAPIAFKNCTALQTLDFPTTLQEIGDGAFYNCPSLARAIIPEGTQKVGEGAFVDCPALVNMSIPKSVTEIGANAFGFKLNETDSYVKNDDFTLSVFSNTAGADYAKKNKLEYSYVDKNIKSTAFIIVAVGLILAAVVFAFVLMARGKKGASISAKKAEKKAKEKEAEENYESIIDKD